ncbi:uncharacterized protein LOC108090685 [Drosophila ficusphila]|uniref:uncharacterized protein LOC108090685 n=1 Tax=Drosophila ficusphila TaxID=30025 RepID=UPI0007E70681|nr:uncharacterized protein LOC108090685 [Drosophila ficusphila]
MPICVYAQANLSLQQQIESTDDLWQSSWRNGRVDKILGPVSRIDTKTCQDTFIKEITEDKICGEPYSMEMNYGSGGAPLEILTIDNGQQKIVQIGVVLLGKPDNTGPLIYSNLLKFSNWIARSVLENI